MSRYRWTSMWSRAGFCAAFVVVEWLRLFRNGVPLLPTGDSTVFMNDARRLLDGQAMYRDFFQFTTPGSQVIYWGLFKLFGVRAWIESAVMLALAVALVWMTLELSRQVLSTWHAFIPALLVAGVVFRYYHDATHHWFSAVTIAAAVCVLAPNRSTQRLIWAGVLCALTAFITQNKGGGLLLGLCVFVAWECWGDRSEIARRLILLAGTSAAAFAVLMSIFIAQSGWRTLYQLLLYFPLTHYSGVYANSWYSSMADWPAGLGMRGLYLLCYGTALAWAPAAVTARREDLPDIHEARIMLIAFAAAGVFAAVLPAANGYRVASVTYLGCVLAVWWLSRAGKAGTAALIALTAAGVAGLVAPTRITATEVDLPVGKVLLASGGMHDAVEWARSATSPGDYFVGNPVVTFAMQYRTPPALQYPSAGKYTTAEQYDELISWSEKNRPAYMMLHPSAFLRVYPTQTGDSGAAFHTYLDEHYRSIGYAGDEEIFEIRSDARNKTAAARHTPGKPEASFHR